MSLSKRYDPQTAEPLLRQAWDENRIYAFDPQGAGELYTIDTPPPTVSGYLHLGHVYSFSHTDFMARFWRMRGRRVFYPMGFDDNGLPTERFVEKEFGVHASEVSRQDYIDTCLKVSREVEELYRDLWQRLGLSIDWCYTYRTIDESSRRIAQWSFLDLHRKGLAYRQQAPAIWCPECRASFAQADLNDLERASEFITLDFHTGEGLRLPVATTRPELLAACVAVFVHPSDRRYIQFIGQEVRVPFYGQPVPVLADPEADPEKGTGAVMCCTFGDPMDVAWWRKHGLPCVELISPDGVMLPAAGPLAGLTVAAARKQMKEMLDSRQLIRARQETVQSVRVHERCDTPVEYLMVQQWFIRLLEHKAQFLALGEQLSWYPAYMGSRYRTWVENLSWDWSISRQRSYGVPFPVWYCSQCEAVVLPEEEDLPVDPSTQAPAHPCPSCGSRDFTPEKDFFDTWMTSSCTPQIVGRWRSQADLYEKVYPYDLRPHAHEIIRTWTFYSVVKGYYHFGRLPWKDVAISGWGIAGEGMGKISKSRGGGPIAPTEMIETYSADAVRYWAASTGPGKDAVISEEKIQSGRRLVTKLWNVARFAERFIQGLTWQPASESPALSPADRWILARIQTVNRRTTAALEEYDYATAKNEVEAFFWHDLADNYLEMVKQRLYDAEYSFNAGAAFTLQRALCTVLKLFAPFLPYVTDTIYRELFSALEGKVSIHASAWPEVEEAFIDPEAESFGEVLVQIASAVRRFKSQHNLPLGSELKRVQLATVDAEMQERLRQASADLKSITRASEIVYTEVLVGVTTTVDSASPIQVNVDLDDRTIAIDN